MCEMLNEYFGTVFTDESGVNELPEVNSKFPEDVNHMLRNVNFTKESISVRLKKLKIKRLQMLMSWFLGY